MVGDARRAAVVQRRRDELAQASLGKALRGWIDGREMQLRGIRGHARIDPPVLRMDELEARRCASRFAITAHPRATGERRLLCPREMEEPERQETRAVSDPAQQLAPASKQHLGQQYLTLDRCALAGAQFPERHQPRPILVAQWQQKQQIFSALDAEDREPQRERLAHALQGRDRPRRGHGWTMQSISMAAPRGSDATPTAARAG